MDVHLRENKGKLLISDRWSLSSKEHLRTWHNDFRSKTKLSQCHSPKLPTHATAHNFQQYSQKMETTNRIEFIFLVNQENTGSEWNRFWFSYVVGFFKRFVWWNQKHKPCTCLEKQINMIRNFTNSQERSHLSAHLAQRTWCQLRWLTAKWRVACDYICSTGSAVSTPTRQCSFGPWAKKGREPRSGPRSSRGVH